MTFAMHARPLVDSHQAEWIAAHAGVPGVEVHADTDAVWMIQPGAVWSNAVAALRLTRKNAAARLDAIVQRFRKHGRGAGFWVGPDATPDNVEELLRARRFRCRKRFPGMACDLRAARAEGRPPTGLQIEPVTDHSIFERSHPYFGPITTPIRKFELARLAHLNGRRRTIDLVAVLGKKPVGACTVHLGKESAGLHDVGVVESHRNRGIGRAIVTEACRVAATQGCTTAVLISSGMGESVYRAVGFREVCKMAFWYQAFR